MSIYRHSQNPLDGGIDAQDNTLLHQICQRPGRLDEIRKLVLQKGVRLDVCNTSNMPPLGVAIMQGETEKVALLIDLGSPLYMEVGEGLFFNAALLAVSAGREDVLRTVLEKGGGHHVNLEGINDNGLKLDGPCLHRAVSHARASLIPLLVRYGAFVNQEAGTRKMTPLQLAAIQIVNAESLQALMLSGADVNAANSENGFTALHYAVMNGKDEAAGALLKFGADPNAREKNGDTPLIIALSSGAANADELAKVLFEHGADPNLRRLTGDKETPLMIAAHKGSHKIVQTLLEAKADPLLTDAFNRTAAAIARRAGVGNTALLIETASDAIAVRNFEKSYNRYRP